MQTKNELRRPEGAALTPAQAHAMLGGDAVLSRASFYAALKRGEIPHRRVGRRILIPKTAFLRWFEGDSRSDTRAGSHNAA